MAEIPRPIPESYWVIPGRLLAGEYPAQYPQELTRRRLDALIEARFDTFIDLTQPHENVPYVKLLQEEAKFYDIEVRHASFPITDFGLPTPKQMNSILDAIEDGLQAGRQIYLHCLGGIGRTGTTVACYLVRQGKTGTQALEQLADWWRSVPKSRYYPRSPETVQQRDFVLAWAEHEAKPR